MGIGWGRTTLSNPVFTKDHFGFSATAPPHEIPAPRFNHAPRSLWRKLFSHQRPRPIRNTASHSTVVNQVEFTRHVLASSPPGLRTGSSRAVTGRHYHPRNSGVRRSANDARPSRQSSVPVISSWPTASSQKAVDLSDSRARLVRYLAMPMAWVGPDANRVAHSPTTDINSARGTTRLTRPRRSAAAAERLGLVNRVVPRAELMSVVGEWATRLASGPTQAIGMAKYLTNRALESDRATAFWDEAVGQELITGTEDCREGLASFAERRTPEFRGW